MMQACDGYEAPPGLPRHDRLGRLDRASHHVTGSLEHPPISRGVAAVEVSLAGAGAAPDQFDVLGGVEGQKFLVGGGAGFLHLGPAIEAAGLEFAVEGAVTVRAEGMALAETVAGQLFAGDD